MPTYRKQNIEMCPATKRSSKHRAWAQRFLTTSSLVSEAQLKTSDWYAWHSGKKSYTMTWMRNYILANMQKCTKTIVMHNLVALIHIMIHDTDCTATATTPTTTAGTWAAARGVEEVAHAAYQNRLIVRVAFLMESSFLSKSSESNNLEKARIPHGGILPTATMWVDKSRESHILYGGTSTSKTIWVDQSRQSHFSRHVDRLIGREPYTR